MVVGMALRSVGQRHQFLRNPVVDYYWTLGRWDMCEVWGELATAQTAAPLLLEGGRKVPVSQCQRPGEVLIMDPT